MRTQFSKFALTAGIMLALAFTSASAQGVYFDIGFGVGSATTKFDGKDAIDNLKAAGYEISSDFGVDIGFKVGYGPIAGAPVYVVGVFGGAGHSITSGSENAQFNSYLLGPGIIVYPISLLQLSFSIGTSWIADQEDGHALDWESDGGYAYDLSVAVDLGNDKHGCLLGIKYFGASNTLKDLPVKKQESSMIGVFVKYAFRTRGE